MLAPTGNVGLGARLTPRSCVTMTGGREGLQECRGGPSQPSPRRSGRLLPSFPALARACLGCAGGAHAQRSPDVRVQSVYSARNAHTCRARTETCMQRTQCNMYAAHAMQHVCSARNARRMQRTQCKAYTANAMRTRVALIPRLAAGPDGDGPGHHAVRGGVQAHVSATRVPPSARHVSLPQRDTCPFRVPVWLPPCKHRRLSPSLIDRPLGWPIVCAASSLRAVGCRQGAGARGRGVGASADSRDQRPYSRRAGSVCGGRCAQRSA